MKPASIILFSFFILFIAACNNKSDTTITGGESVAEEIKDEALIVINDAIAKDSSNATAWYAKGKYYFNKQQYEEAIPNLLKATELDSGKREYFINLSDAYFYSNQTFGTKTTLEHMLTIYPDDEMANFKLAELLFYVKHYEDAFKYASKVSKLNPDDLKSIFLSGMIKKEAGDTAQALNFFRICTEKNPKYYEAYMQLAIINSALRNKLAVEYFNAAIKLNPNSEEALYGLAMYYQYLPDYDRAIEEYTALLQKNPRHRDAMFNLGYIHQVDLSVPKVAIRHYNDLLALFPQDYKAIYNRGVCFEKLGDVNAAKTDFQKAIDIMPSYDKAREGLKRVMR